MYIEGSIIVPHNMFHLIQIKSKEIMKNKKLTQIQRVINQIERTGKVTNFWAIHNYILRLGAIIYTLRTMGWELDGNFSEKTKNFVYKLVSKPNEK